MHCCPFHLFLVLVSPILNVRFSCLCNTDPLSGAELYANASLPGIKHGAAFANVLFVAPVRLRSCVHCTAIYFWMCFVDVFVR